MSGIYGIAVSALNAAQAGLATTSNNIANANTPGYSLEKIVQAQAQSQNTGAGFIGQGVNVTTVVRQYDQFLGAQVLSAQTQSSSLNTQLGLAQQVSNLLGDFQQRPDARNAKFFYGGQCRCQRAAIRAGPPDIDQQRAIAGGWLSVHEPEFESDP